MLPSAATAPQLLSNQAHSRHAAPCLEHLFIASFFGLSRSFQPNDQPAPLSLALYAIAPQNLIFEHFTSHSALRFKQKSLLLPKSAQVEVSHSYRHRPTVWASTEAGQEDSIASRKMTNPDFSS